MKYKYIYQGQNQVFLPGFGLVNPGEVIEVDFEINISFFHRAEDKTKKPARSKVKEHND